LADIPYALLGLVRNEAREGFVMVTVATRCRGNKNGFDAVAEPFLQGEGLPFSDVLNAECIEHVFHEENALFGQDDIFSTQIVLWAFLAQTLRDGKGAACSAAVSEIATYMLQSGQRPPSGDTGDYCRARAKLSLPALQRLVGESARQLERDADESWLWKGLHAKLVDGFTFTMPDTPENQEVFPQSHTQRPGVGFPIARCCTVVSLATACVCDMGIGPYQGKATGENALLRDMLDAFDQGDVAVFDRYYCSFMMLATLSLGGTQVCARLHQRRPSDFRRGRRLGKDDHLITWTRPAKPAWMSLEEYDRMPHTLTLRELRFNVIVPGRRTEVITVVTTLTDAHEYSKEDVAALYGFRWNVELDIRAIKQTLGLDHVRCKTPEMVLRELWVTLLAYNLIRKVIVTSAAIHGKQPRSLGFTLACQTILASWMLLSTGSCLNSRAMYTTMLTHIAANEVANRPGRIEPRVLKRRRHRYPLMQRPRDQLRSELGKT
jgi:putative transposase